MIQIICCWFSRNQWLNIFHLVYLTVSEFMCRKDQGFYLLHCIKVVYDNRVHFSPNRWQLSFWTDDSYHFWHTTAATTIYYTVPTAVTTVVCQKYYLSSVENDSCHLLGTNLVICLDLPNSNLGMHYHNLFNLVCLTLPELYVVRSRVSTPYYKFTFTFASK